MTGMESKKEVFLNEHRLRFEDESDPGEFFLAKAAEELRETPERREQALVEFKNLLANEPALEIPLTEDILFIAYLRACKFYPESAFGRICSQYRFRAKYPKYCANLIPSLEKNVFQNNILTVLPYRDQHGRRILLVEAGKKWNTREVTLPEIVRGVLLIVDGAMLEPRTQIAGAVVVIDLEGLSLQHVWQFSPNVAKMLLDWVQECVPCRVKAVHIINQPYIFNMLFAIFKPFIKEKLRNRIHFHGENRASLLEYIEAKSLPTQYGGDLNIETNQGIKLHQLLSQYNCMYEKAAGYGFCKKGNDGKKIPT